MLKQQLSTIERQVERGISILKQGGLVAFPTDTVYGLGACADLHHAVERVYQVKERPQNMALPLLLAHTSQISKVAYPVPDIAWLLAEKFLPGALTLVLYKSDSVLDIVTGDGMTVAVRVPAHPIPIALIEGVGSPVIGTSANLSGKPNPLTADDIYSQFGDKIDLVIEDNVRLGGKVSTVVDVTGEKPVILREGVISKERLRQVCGDIALKEAK